VFLVDNSSSYPPLLDWYETIRKNPDVHIVKLGENLGPHVIYNRLSFFKEKYHEITGHQLPDEFIITDCDLDISAVPDDGLKILYQLREEDRKSERVKDRTLKSVSVYGWTIYLMTRCYGEQKSGNRSFIRILPLWPGLRYTWIH